MSAVLKNPGGPPGAAARLVRSFAQAKGGFVSHHSENLTSKLTRHLRQDPDSLKPAKDKADSDPPLQFRLSRRSGTRTRATLRWLNIAAGDRWHPSQQVREAARGISKLNLNWGQLEEALHRYRSIRLRAARAAASDQPVTDRPGHQFPGGETITPVRTPSELHALGHTLRNCMAGPAFKTARRTMKQGTSEYYVLRDADGEPAGLMEVSNDDGMRTVDEVKGPGNSVVEGWAARISEYLQLEGIACGDHCGDLIAMGVSDQYCTAEEPPRTLFDGDIDGLACRVEMPGMSGEQYYVDLRLTYDGVCGLARYGKGQVIPLITFMGGGLYSEQIIYLLLKSRIDLAKIGVEVCLPDPGDPIARRLAMRSRNGLLLDDEAEE